MQQTKNMETSRKREKENQKIFIFYFKEKVNCV